MQGAVAGTGTPGNKGGDARRSSQSGHSTRIAIKNETGGEDTGKSTEQRAGEC